MCLAAPTSIHIGVRGRATALYIGDFPVAVVDGMPELLAPITLCWSRLTSPRFNPDAMHQEEFVDILYGKRQSGCLIKDAEEDALRSSSSFLNTAGIFWFEILHPKRLHDHLDLLCWYRLDGRERRP